MPIGIIAVSWVTFIIVLLMFPPGQTVVAKDMNYAVVIIMAVFVFASGWWIISAHMWFTGPVKTVESGTSTPEYDEKQRDLQQST